MDFFADRNPLLDRLLTGKSGIHTGGAFHHLFPECQKFLVRIKLSHGIVLYLHLLQR